MEDEQGPDREDDDEPRTTKEVLNDGPEKHSPSAATLLQQAENLMEVEEVSFDCKSP